MDKDELWDWYETVRDIWGFAEHDTPEDEMAFFGDWEEELYTAYTDAYGDPTKGATLLCWGKPPKVVMSKEYGWIKIKGYESK